MNVEELRRYGRSTLAPLAVRGDADRVEETILAQEVDQLLCEALGCSFSTLVMAGRRPASASQVDLFNAMLSRRLALEPVAYILGHVGFHTIELSVSPAVLIPRPETELLVDRALSFFSAEDVHPTLIDIGTGSGAIVLAAAAALKERFGSGYLTRGNFIGSDLSVDALTVARHNAATLALSPAVRFCEGDLAAWITELGAGSPEVITANLPYIPNNEALPHSVSGYEPALALHGGESGFELIFRLINQVSARIREGSVLLLEVGADQYSDIESHVRQWGFESRAFCDLHGICRTAEIRRGS